MSPWFLAGLLGGLGSGLLLFVCHRLERHIGMGWATALWLVGLLMIVSGSWLAGMAIA